jgi:hypothetical protein
VIKGDLIKEDAYFLKDNTFVRNVTFESVMDDYRNIFEYAGCYSTSKRKEIS